MTDATDPSAHTQPEAVPPEIDQGALGIEIPADPNEAQQVLTQATLEARTEAADYLAAMQRIAAEFDNFKKRIERDRVELISRATNKLVSELLPSLDNFDAALAYGANTPAEESLLAGMRSTHTQLMETLKVAGLEPVDGAGNPFDPARHEAVSGPVGDGKLVVATTLRRGYFLGGKLLRAALVTVEREG